MKTAAGAPNRGMFALSVLGAGLLVASAGLIVASEGFASEKKSVVPPYEIIKTKNGVPVYYFSNPNVPLFEVHLDYGGGGNIDPAGRSGLGTFAAGMIRRGVPGLDEDEISRRLDDVAGAVEVGVEDDDTVVSAFGLTAQAATITGLMFKQLAEPTFPRGPFERLKRNHLDGIAQIPDAPEALATQVLDAIVYNRTINERPTGGLLREVKGITVELAREHFPALLRTDRLSAFVVGGASREEVLDRVVRGIEGLPCPRCGKPIIEPRSFDFPPARVPKGSVVLVDRPGLSQAHVRMGFLGPKRNVPDFYELRVAETILGGYFAARLNMIIREKLNLTYNIAAGFTFGQNMGEFSLSASTRNEKLTDLLREVGKILRGFADGDVTDDEVQMAKDYLVGSFPIGLDSVYVIAETFFSGLLNGLPADFLDRYIVGVGGVTREGVVAALKRRMTLDDMTTVIVGDRASLAPKLKAAKVPYIERPARRFL